MSDRVHISISHGIADVRMTRADKRNALDGAMFTALAEAGERLKTEPEAAGVHKLISDWEPLKSVA